ncbi:MAG: NADP-specific glutamate dehydrogenase [Spongiibacteraceae bacterium]|nr:NADP-specific glutamate dehydrogenase [Spongiibacteraceae bacterium]
MDVLKYLKQLEQSSPGQTEYYQAVEEVLSSLGPLFAAERRYWDEGVIERLLEPERQVMFRVAWVDDSGRVRVNKGYRVQFNSALGPYKGGLRFHSSVNGGIIKFLGFEQIFKNALTGLPLGGGKGGSDFNPKGCSKGEVMRFCQAFMTALYRHIGATVDVPAGDIGVGQREIGYLYGQYRRLSGRFEGALTGKATGWGGSLGRREATGYGCVYFAENMLAERGDSIEGKVCLVSGSGNVALYTMEKLEQLGAKSITCSDSTGTLIHRAGMDVGLLKDIKERDRRPLKDYLESHHDAIFIPTSDYDNGRLPVWQERADMAFPCATQNELCGVDAETMVANGVICVSEGANMPSTREAVSCFLQAGISYGPGKAANAGGVAVSQLEMQQNAAMARWSAEKVDDTLRVIMRDIHHRASSTAREFGTPGNLVLGANIAGFRRVADAMIEQGVY